MSDINARRGLQLIMLVIALPPLGRTLVVALLTGLVATFVVNFLAGGSLGLFVLVACHTALCWDAWRGGAYDGASRFRPGSGLVVKSLDILTLVRI